MAITATFAADFSDFAKQVAAMDKQLQDFTKTSNTTSDAVIRMSTASTTTAPKVASLSTQFKQFDGVLNAAGINAGPAVKALEDIAGASGKSALAMGALGTAGLAVGTFMAAFKLTSAILEFTGLNKVIGDVVTSFNDFGLAAAEAGAKQDTINNAIRNGAKEGISYGDAVRYMDTWAKEHKKTATDNAKAYADWAEATKILNTYGTDWKTTLDTINGSVVEAVKGYIEAGVAQDVLQKAYGLTKGQIDAIVLAMQAEKAEAKLVEAEHKRVTDEIKKHYDAVQAVRDKFFGADAIKQAQLYAEAINTNKTSIQQLNEEGLREFQKVMIAANEAMVRGGQAASAENLAFSQMAVEAGKMLEALNPVVKVTDDLAKEQWDYVTALDAGLVAMKKAKDEADKIAADAAGKKKEFAGGALVPGQGQVLARMAPGTGYDLFGRPGIQPLGAPTAPITINVNGNILSTANEVFRMMSEATRRSFASGGNRLPV